MTLAETRAEAAATLRIGGGMVAVAAIVAVLWAAAAATRAVGTPAATLAILLDGFGRGWLWPHLWATSAAVVGGFAFAVVAGVLLGVWLGRSPYWRAVLEPVLLSAYSIPKVTLYPVLILIFGLTLQSRIAMSFIHAVFPVVIATTVSVAEIDPVLHKLRRSLRLSGWQALLKIYVPAIAPPLVAALRMAFSLAIIGVVLAELFASKEGLGRLVIDAYSRFDVDRMFAVILFLFLAAFVANSGFWLIERRLRPR